MEQWKVIEEAPDYAVSSLGRVKRIRADKMGRGEGNLLKTPLGDAGYPVCALHVNGKQLHRRTYVLVCRTFHGPKPTPKHEVRHLDGNKLNPRADNLAWGTSKENKNDCERHGTIRRGEQRRNSKLTTDQVLAIRASTENFKIVAARYGITPNHVHTLRRGSSWAHLNQA